MLHRAKRALQPKRQTDTARIMAVRTVWLTLFRLPAGVTVRHRIRQGGRMPMTVQVTATAGRPVSRTADGCSGMLQFVQRPRKHSTEDNGQNRSQSHCLHDGCVETGHNSGLYSEQADWRLRRRTGSTSWIIRHKATLYKVEPSQISQTAMRAACWKSPFDQSRFPE